MSRRGFAEPKIDPTSSFCISVRSNRLMVTSVSLMSATDVCTTRPPLPMIAIAGAMWWPRPSPTVMMHFSAMAPQVRSITSAVASSSDEAVWVAPNTCACSRLNSTGSTAITFAAPAMAAPCTAFMPTPPQPTITTVSPDFTSAA